MMDLMYSVPSDPSIESVVIRKDEQTGEIVPEIHHRISAEVSG